MKKLLFIVLLMAFATGCQKGNEVSTGENRTIQYPSEWGKVVSVSQGNINPLVTFSNGYVCNVENEGLKIMFKFVPTRPSKPSLL